VWRRRLLRRWSKSAGIQLEPGKRKEKFQKIIIEISKKEK
jgi:hypothetical protein